MVEKIELPWDLLEGGVEVVPQQTALLAGERGELEDHLADQVPLIDRGVHYMPVDLAMRAPR